MSDYSIFKRVKVNVDKKTGGLQQKGFGVINILGDNLSSANRYEYFTSLDDVLANLGDDQAPEYLASKAIFQSKKPPEKVMISKKEVGDSGYIEAINAVQAATDSWYGFVLSSRSNSDQEALADWIEAQDKVAAFSSADPNIVDQDKDTDTTSIAHHVKSNALTRSMAIYDPDATTQFLDAAALADGLGRSPGYWTLNSKTFPGITPHNLSGTQVTNAEEKLANFYTAIGLNGRFLESTIGDGDFIDTTVFIDWLRFRLAEYVFDLISKAGKVMYTDPGIASVQSRMEEVYQIAQTPNAENVYAIGPSLFDDDDNQYSGYSIRVPSAASISTVQKSTRELVDIYSTVWYTGAIHKVAIDVQLTY